MKVFLIVLFLLSANLFCAQVDLSDESLSTNIELSGSSSMGLNLTRAGGVTTYAFSISGGLDFLVANNIQVGGAPFIGFGSGDVMALGFMVGPTLNLPISYDIRNAFFVGIGIGILYSKVQDLSNTSFGLSIPFGKRFPIFGNFIYKPYIELTFWFSPSIVSVDVMPISFSGFF